MYILHICTINNGLLFFTGESHPNTLKARHSLAMAAAAMGQHDAADVLYTRVLNEREATRGADTADTLRTVSWIYIHICMYIYYI